MPQNVLQLLLLEFGFDLTPGCFDGIVQQAAHRRGVHLLNYSVQEAVPVVVCPEIVQDQKRQPAIVVGDNGWNQVLAYVRLEAERSELRTW